MLFTQKLQVSWEFLDVFVNLIYGCQMFDDTKSNSILKKFTFNVLSNKK